MNLNTVKYRYKDNNALGILNEREHSGFIAQDVQKVIPEAVRKTTDDFLTVDNDPIFLALINATKEQQDRIDDSVTETHWDHRQKSRCQTWRWY